MAWLALSFRPDDVRLSSLFPVMVGGCWACRDALDVVAVGFGSNQQANESAARAVKIVQVVAVHLYWLLASSSAPPTVFQRYLGAVAPEMLPY